jgi:chromosome segregation ATPase
MKTIGRIATFCEAAYADLREIRDALEEARESTREFGRIQRSTIKQLHEFVDERDQRIRGLEAELQASNGRAEGLAKALEESETRSQFDSRVPRMLAEGLAKALEESESKRMALEKELGDAKAAHEFHKTRDFISEALMAKAKAAMGEARMTAAHGVLHDAIETLRDEAERMPNRAEPLQDWADALDAQGTRTRLLSLDEHPERWIVFSCATTAFFQNRRDAEARKTMLPNGPYRMRLEVVEEEPNAAP